MRRHVASTAMFTAGLVLAGSVSMGGGAAAAPATATSSGEMRTVHSALVTSAPRPAVALPKQLDVRPRYQPQTTCDPVARTGTRALGALLVGHYKRGTLGYERSCTGSSSEHYDGRAVDWMLDARNASDLRVANAATSWLSANQGAMARRLGVQYIIWNKKMWRAYAPERGWTAYTGASPHTDHVHISLTWDGALKRTSWWTGRALTAMGPAPAPRSVRSAPPGSVGAPPRITKTAPKVAPVVVATPLTNYKRAGLRPGSSGAAVRAVQRALKVPVTGRYDAATVRAVLAVQKRWKIAQSGRVDARTWNRIELTRYPWLPYVGQKLQQGSRGRAVTEVQRLLGIKADGVLGPHTAAVLRGTKKRLGLRPTGVVDRATWQAFTRL